ncbi:hypothetical protein [Aurantiacibacter zhengii]|uniref:hypothetical protein n=1 Tax=Aurantiacibacter zhengii TaxID=2307003 RepID=UPI001F1DA27A|nr:hypothetical protein [Aurantiacibacter zhengii]
MILSTARLARVLPALALATLLSACASQIDAGVVPEGAGPGFWWGLWHGFVFPFAFVGSLFNNEIAVYAVPNSGGWYDFGFFLGITVLGGGSVFGSKKRK